MAEMASSGERLREGEAALARGAWDEARAVFEQEVEVCETVEALEGLSWVAWWRFPPTDPVRTDRGAAGRLDHRRISAVPPPTAHEHRQRSPADLLQIDLEDYRNPADLPAGPVLVVGSRQSGCQLAEELHQAGREVFLACGRAPWMPRRLGGRDLAWWALETGFLDAPLSSLPSPAARLAANVQATGVGGGHDLHYRTLRKLGVTLLGRLLAADGRHARFAPDLGASVARGDQRNAQLMD